MTVFIHEKPISAADHDWVGHGACERPGQLESIMITNRDMVLVLAEISDDNACYDYDDFALCLFGGGFYLLQTSGCSCPSPSETWRVDIGPCSLSDIRRYLTSGKYEGYTVPGRQLDQFMAAIDAAEREFGTVTPFNQAQSYGRLATPNRGKPPDA